MAFFQRDSEPVATTPSMNGGAPQQTFIDPPPGMVLPTNPVSVPVAQGGGSSGATISLTGTDDPTNVFREIIPFLGTADINDRNSINNLVTTLRNRGYNVQPGPVDEFGRQDSVIINGQLYRAIDSSGNWNLVSNANGTAWGPSSSSGFGGGASSVSPFGGLSLEDFQNSPGYQFALKEGQRAIQNSAAAKGTLLTGGTLKDLDEYTVGLASQDYANAFNRALQTHQTQFGDLFNLSNLGLNATNSSFS